MMATYRLKGLGWLAVVSVAAISFYLVSSQAAAERKRLEEVDARIAAAQRDIRALETEFDVRANMGQLERWNGDTLALTVPTARQFVGGERQFARLAPGALRPLEGEVRTAALIVPATPVIAAPAVVAASALPAAAVVRTAAATQAAPRTASRVAMLDDQLLKGNAGATLLAAAHTAR